MQLRLLIIMLLIFITGCSNTGAIQLAGTGKSGFEGAVYSGDTVELLKPTPGAEVYRIFHQASTGFVSVASVRVSAEHRATSFCTNIGRTPRYIRETTSRPPHILGNFPRIELEFECVPRAANLQAESPDRDKYATLERLKRLLDSGALTEQEYTAEKVRILAAP